MSMPLARLSIICMYRQSTFLQLVFVRRHAFRDVRRLYTTLLF